MTGFQDIWYVVQWFNNTTQTKPKETNTVVSLKMKLLLFDHMELQIEFH